MADLDNRSSVMYSPHLVTAASHGWLSCTILSCSTGAAHSVRHGIQAHSVHPAAQQSSCMVHPSNAYYSGVACPACVVAATGHTVQSYNTAAGHTEQYCSQEQCSTGRHCSMAHCWIAALRHDISFYGLGQNGNVRGKHRGVHVHVRHGLSLQTPLQMDRG